eukprot:2905972-Ditylum_brightwellii.AAC.3
MQDSELKGLAIMRLTDGKGGLAVVIKNIKHCEDMKPAFKQMKPITKGITGGAVNTILVPNPERISCTGMYSNVNCSLKFKCAETFIPIN